MTSKGDSATKPAEIAAEALRQFDEVEGAPDVESLAAALALQPAEIERHFPSRADITRAAVAEVWNDCSSGSASRASRPPPPSTPTPRS